MKIYHWYEACRHTWQFTYPSWRKNPPEAEEYELELPKGFKPNANGGREIIEGTDQDWVLRYNVVYEMDGETWRFSLRAGDYPGTEDIDLGEIKRGRKC